MKLDERRKEKISSMASRPRAWRRFRVQVPLHWMASFVLPSSEKVANRTEFVKSACPSIFAKIEDVNSPVAFVDAGIATVELWARHEKPKLSADSDGVLVSTTPGPCLVRVGSWAFSGIGMVLELASVAVVIEHRNSERTSVWDNDIIALFVGQWDDARR